MSTFPRILLTGSNGQVGWELQRSLASLGRLVTADRSTCDLADPDSIRRAIREIQPDMVVNAAAYTTVDQAEDEAELAMQVNGVAPGIIAEETKNIGAAMIHYSTDYVFDGRGDTPWREQDTPAPLNVYGRTKLAGEQAIQEAGLPHLILRTSWVYGLHGNNFVKTMLRLGMEREELKIVDDQMGAPTSARVIADITGQILAQAHGQISDYLGLHGGLFHLSCGGATSWHGFAEEIFRIARSQQAPLQLERLLPIASKDYPVKAMRPKNSRLDCQRLAEQFGLQAPDWITALQHSFPMLPGV